MSDLGHVLILAGGLSAEREVSLRSGSRLRDALREAGVDADIADADAGLIPAITSDPPSAVFPAIHGAYGEDGSIQEVLALLGVPFVGAAAEACRFAFDKPVAKAVAHAAGLATPASVTLPKETFHDLGATAVLEHIVATLGLPLFVKPARLGSSVGIVKVTDADEIDGALETAFGHDGLVIVEAFSDGMEVECSVLGLAEPEASLPGEIVLKGADWYDYAAKYEPGGMELVVPARIPEAVQEEVRRLARDTFVRVGCAGLARVDFFVEGERVLVNELNTLPGFTQTSVYPKLWEATGLAFPELCDRLLQTALDRFRSERGGHAF